MKKFIILLIILFNTICTNASELAQKFVLENGQTVIIKEIHSNPIVTMDTWIKTGSINEDDTNNGVSHFLEHLFFRGSKNHAPGEFDKLLETKGAITNAATSKDFTHYYITIPSKYFNEAMELHADMLTNPLIPRKELEKERKVVLEEISKDENSPQKILYENLVSLMYTQHPYKRKVIGQRNIIETIHRDEIIKYYDKWYYPSNMITVVVGDIDTKTALDKIKKEFSVNNKKPDKPVYAKEKPLTKQLRKIEYLDTQSGYILIGFRGVDVNNSDSYALDVLATILGEGRTSVFYNNIKDKLQLAFSIDASNNGAKDDGIFYISAKFIPDKLDKLQSEIFKEIELIKQNGVSEAQVNLAKNIIERDTYYQRESVSNIAQEIGFVMVTSGDIKVYDNYVDNIKKVTPQDVKRVAEKYLGIEKSAVSIVLPEKSKEVKISEKKQTEGSPVFISEYGDSKKYKLPNQSTLILNQNDSNKIIAISIYAKGGSFLENKYGTANLMASTILKGTKKYSSRELAEIMEDDGIKIIPSVRSDAFILNVLTTEQQYEMTLELLSEIINNATFSEYELEKVKQEKLQTIRQSRDLPLNLAIEGYKDLIFKGTPYTNSTILLEKEIPQISREDIITYYKNIFTPENIVISINGNVDKDLTTNHFSTIFNSENGAKIDLNNFKGRITPLSNAQQTIKTVPVTNTDWIFIAWQTAGLDNIKDYATLKVIDSLLGTGMSSRMFKNLRDQEGLAYQLGSGYSANALKGAFIIYIGTNPQTYQQALDGLWKEINLLKTEFVGTKELQEAKEKLSGNYILSMETNMEKASTEGWFETALSNAEFINEFVNTINSVTETDIMRVANQYFKKNNYVLSVVKK